LERRRSGKCILVPYSLPSARIGALNELDVPRLDSNRGNDVRGQIQDKVASPPLPSSGRAYLQEWVLGTDSHCGCRWKRFVASSHPRRDQRSRAALVAATIHQRFEGYGPGHSNAPAEASFLSKSQIGPRRIRTTAR